MHPDDFLPLDAPRIPLPDARARLDAFRETMRTRRSVRHFSPDAVPYDLIETAIAAAASAPSGANLQPWRFVVVSDPTLKHRIREAAEAEERRNYEERFPEEWKRDLAPLGTDWHKEFIDVAPYLIVVFQISYPEDPERKRKHYYVTESVGIAVGFLLAALQHAGLAALTHTPNPMGFLNEILERPRNERPFVLIPVGYPAADARVPKLRRKPLGDVLLHRG